MTRRLRTTVNLVACAMTIGAIALGASWLTDRTRRWERPEWRHPSFVRMRGGSETTQVPGALWVVAVNPRCPHCMATLTRLRETWDRNAWRDDLAALIVDTPRRPDSQALRCIPTDQVWWDRDGVWRLRWGHRLYGELIQFDASGRFVRTALATDILRCARLPEPGVPLAPATMQEGGS